MKCFFLFLVGLILLSSCRKGNESGWNTELLLPIANTTLTLQNLVNDTSLKTNPDNSLMIAYSTPLYSFNLANALVNIPDTSIGQKYTLDSLTLPNQSYLNRTSLGQIAINMLSGPGLDPIIGQTLLNDNGSSTPVAPFGGLNLGTFTFNNAQFYDSATLITGVMEIWIKNLLPVDITGAVFTLSNHGESTPIATRNIPTIPPPQGPGIDSVFLEIPLSGVRILNLLDISITNVGTDGSTTPVLIDTSKYVEAHLFITQLHVSEAWAVFQNQTILNETEEVTTLIRDRKLTYVQARQGELYVNISSSVEQPLYLQYTMLGAFNNQGQPLVMYTNVPAAPVNGTIAIHDSINIAGYSINLTGVSGTEFNTYSQQIIAQLVANGQTTHITLADSLNVKYTISEVLPSYVKGYFGRDTIVAIDTTSFSFLNIFKSGTLNLSGVNMNFEVVNGLGVGGVVKINGLTAMSSVNPSVNLTGSIIGQPLTVNRATDFPLTPAINNFSLNSGNSNISSLLSILPNRLKYNVQINTNVNGNNGQYRDFAYDESGLNINLNAQIPLSLIANNLLLVDTIPFNLANTNTNVNGITNGVINLVVENSYPVQTVLTVTVYDSTWAPVDTLVLNGMVSAGVLDADCKVDGPKQTVISVNVSQAVMNNLKRGRNAIISANFSTSSSNTCNGQYLKIYSNYNLGITFTAKFNYKVNTNF